MIAFHPVVYKRKDFQYGDAIRRYTKLFGVEWNTSKLIYMCEFDPIDATEVTSDIVRIEGGQIPANIINMAMKNQAIIVFNFIEFIDHNMAACNAELMLHGIPRGAVRFITMKDKPSYFSNFWLTYAIQIKNSNTVSEINQNVRLKKFVCLNRIPRHNRRYVASEILNRKIDADFYLSYQVTWPWKNNGDRHSSQPDWVDIIDSTLLDARTPIIVDDLSLLAMNVHSNVSTQFYTDAYWNLVTETECLSYVTVMTEKTFKPIANLQPFVIAGGHHTLFNLKKMGFQTFGNYIDESYDNILNDGLRLQAVMDLVTEMASWSHKKHVSLIKKISPILKHNHTVFNSADSVQQRLIKIIS